MTLRSRRLRGRRLAALLAMAAVLLTALPAGAATSVEITARPLLLGRYQSGGWLALQVELVNDGAPTEGYVAADSPDGTSRRFVELPAGARKSVALYVRPQGFQRQIQVRFEATEGNATTTADIRAFERSSAQVGIVGDGGGNLRPQIGGQVDSGTPEPISLAPGDFPERPEPLEGFAGLVWAGDSSTLGEAERRSIERWVAAGGQLVVVGGPDWQARTAAFADLLPVEDLTAVDDADLASLAAWAGAEQAPTEGGSDSSASGSLRPGAVALAGDAAAPLLSMVARGAGRVIYVSVDMATESYRGWDGGPALWARLLPTNVALEEFFGGGFPIEEETANVMSQALGNLPSLEVPPAELLLLVIIGYIVLIGPASYILLRRMDRRELAWLTAPLLVVVFTACSYGIGTSLKGSTIILNQITLVRSAANGSAASVQTYAGLFSPSRSSYDLTVEADALLAPMSTSSGFAAPNQQTSRYVTEQGDPAHLRGLSVGVFGFQAVRADAIVPHEPSLEVTWEMSGNQIVGTVTNVGTEALDDVALAARSGGEMIGDLAPGQSADFTHSTSNFNGSSASDQIYGFGGGFDSSSEEQRRILVRRQVIDALVGFAHFFPMGGVDMGIGYGRGPVIIGWHPGEGPAPVTVDGQTVQRHTQVVEVVSGRPLLQAGEVEIPASQMGVRIIFTDGNASVQSPGYVNLGNGEAIFAVSLPLEAAGLVPAKVTIVTGPDPGMVLTDQGGFMGGFVPPGYTLHVRNVTTGAWIELGDLSTQSTFEVDDTASVMGADGRIEVRVVGEGQNLDFGQASIFVSARVEGTLAR